jgi:pimeloyl-ACP methyl ester carboxylesterase
MLDRAGSVLAVACSVLRGLAHGDGPTWSGPARARPIVVLHGFAASSGVLTPLAAYLERRLQRPVVRLPLGHRLPLHVHDVRATALRVQRALEDLAAERGFETLDVVGHSMGGLVAAYLLKRLDCGRRIRRVITLGSPHRGTPIALLGVLLLGAVTRCVWQMLPGSSLIRELALLPVPAGTELISIGAGGDRVVPPRFTLLTSARGQRNACVPNLAHLDMLLSPSLFHRIACELGERVSTEQEDKLAA